MIGVRTRRTIAAAMRRDRRSSPNPKIRSASSCSGSPLTRSAAVGPVVGAHPHVERAVLPVAEPALGAVELHRRDPEVEEDAVDRPVDDLLVDLGEAGPDRRNRSPNGREALAPRRRAPSGSRSTPTSLPTPARAAPPRDRRRRASCRPPLRVPPRNPITSRDHDRLVRRAPAPSPDVARRARRCRSRRAG